MQEPQVLHASRIRLEAGNDDVSTQEHVFEAPSESLRLSFCERRKWGRHRVLLS